MMRTNSTGFTFMVAGRTNLGKSTFINCLLEQEVVPTTHITTNSLNVYTLNYDLEGLRKKFSVIDTPSFCYNLNDEKTHENIESYLKSQFDEFLAEETKIRRNPKFEDTRVHCLLYFIAPTPHGLTPNDLSFLQRVKKLVNIIPIIGKSDGLTMHELIFLREKVKKQFKEHEIRYFDFESDVNSHLKLDLEVNERIPFSNINYEAQHSDRLNKLRHFDGGVINTEDGNNCDFRLIKEILLSNYVDNLIDKTATVLYEDYRSEVLGGMIE